MTRRSLLAALLSVTGCRELKRYHSRVKFSLSTLTPSAGQAFEASIDTMDATDEVCEFVLLRKPDGAEIDRAALPPGARRVSLTAREPGPHSVELRWSDRMIAHCNVTVR